MTNKPDQCPHQVNRLAGDEVFTECGFDGRLCQKEYTPEYVCEIYESWLKEIEDEQ